MEPTLVTWVLIIWGAITLAPLTAVQLALLLNPHSARSKEWVIGKDEDWRDKTHFRFALGAAWADWLVIVPLFVAGVVGCFAARPGDMSASERHRALTNPRERFSRTARALVNLA